MWCRVQSWDNMPTKKNKKKKDAATARAITGVEFQRLRELAKAAFNDGDWDGSARLFTRAAAACPVSQPLFERHCFYRVITATLGGFEGGHETIQTGNPYTAARLQTCLGALRRAEALAPLCAAMGARRTAAAPCAYSDEIPFGGFELSPHRRPPAMAAAPAAAAAAGQQQQQQQQQQEQQEQADPMAQYFRQLVPSVVKWARREGTYQELRRRAEELEEERQIAASIAAYDACLAAVPRAALFDGERANIMADTCKGLLDAGLPAAALRRAAEAVALDAQEPNAWWYRGVARLAVTGASDHRAREAVRSDLRAAIEVERGAVKHGTSGNAATYEARARALESGCFGLRAAVAQLLEDATARRPSQAIVRRAVRDTTAFMAHSAEPVAQWSQPAREGMLRDRNALTGCCDWGCVKCGGAGANKRCSSCGLVKYCGAGCQKLDWPEHKAVCKLELARRKTWAQHAAEHEVMRAQVGGAHGSAAAVTCNPLPSARLADAHNRWADAGDTLVSRLGDAERLVPRIGVPGGLARDVGTQMREVREAHGAWGAHGTAERLFAFVAAALGAARTLNRVCTCEERPAAQRLGGAREAQPVYAAFCEMARLLSAAHAQFGTLCAWLPDLGASPQVGGRRCFALAVPPSS